MASGVDKLKQRITDAKRLEDRLDRRLFVLGVITEAMSEVGVKPILVGGSAVEFYTFGGYATQDMDVVMPGSREVEGVMAGLGFRRSGRYWTRRDLHIMLEAPAPPLAGDPNRVIEIDLGESVVYVIGIEDLLIDRLNAYVHWGSEEDGRWAERLLAGCADKVDWSYLESRARAEGAERALRELRNRAAGD